MKGNAGIARRVLAVHMTCSTCSKNLLNADFKYIMCVIRCSQKCHVSLLLALLGFWCSVSFTNLFSLPILFFVSVFLFFLQLKNALLILTSTFLFQSQLAWHLASLSFLSLYLISSEEEKVVLAISLYNLLITSLLPPLCSSVPLKTCPFKNKQNVHSFFFFY